MLAALLLLAVIFVVYSGGRVPATEPSVLLLSTLFALALSVLFVEHYFTSPTDVAANALAILLMLAPLRSQLARMGGWYTALMVYNSVILVGALASILLFDAARAESSRRNRAAQVLRSICTFAGKGKVLYFGLAVLTMLFYVDRPSWFFLAVFAFAIVMLAIDPKKALLVVARRSRHPGADVGEIFCVQSRYMFVARLFGEHPPLRRFDLVEFHYSMDDANELRTGIVTDIYFLNKEQWARVLTSAEVATPATTAVRRDHRPNVLYKLLEPGTATSLERFVGVVVEGSTIDKVRFDYAEKARISEGQLVEIRVDGQTVLYQVVQGRTEVEQLESRNEAGLVVGEAIQLGVWNVANRKFEKFGWVPDINTPVMLAAAAEVPAETGEVRIGSIPGTNYPILMNVEEAVAHHTAVLGVTGSGKSVFVRQMIREIARRGYKVICVDFTNEYKGKLRDLDATAVIDVEATKTAIENADKLCAELDKFPNRRNENTMKACGDAIRTTFFESLASFLKSDTKQVALFELPDVANTTGILEYTRWFFRAVFGIAKRYGNYGKKLCVVIEEAHTVVPESTFLGVGDKHATSLVNSIGQIALQGRKYSVGFVVVAQRTANVSKTVLTQCNSIVAFQQFDDTSGRFLANYFGADMVAALPHLRFRQAIAMGKGFRTGIPVIFEVPVIQEPQVTTESSPTSPQVTDSDVPHTPAPQQDSGTT